MTRYFNTEGWCNPDQHYMVRLDERLDKIKRLYVDRGKYFVINRGRQYGKTTTLSLLKNKLEDCYAVFSISFEGIGEASFESGETLAYTFLCLLNDCLDYGEVKQASDNMRKLIAENVPGETGKMPVLRLSRLISQVCMASEKPIVLFIDEVDQAGNHKAFIEFLGMLRDKYLKRTERPTFQSVILAGVYDIKNLKLKLRSDEQHQYNSPWNIAARFEVDMFFDAGQIAAMLEEYEADYQTGMDREAVAEEIYQYTSGYPYLVSAICKYLDEEVPGREGFADTYAVWTKEGIAEAVKMILAERSPLFDSMTRQLDTYKELRGLIEEILYQGKKVPFSPDAKSANLGLMFGYLKDDNGRLVVSNRIFEMRMLNMFITEEALKSDAYRSGDRDKNQFIQNARLDMRLVLEKFVEYFHDVYGENDEKFVESYGRKFFLLYLKPIINGTGNYYLEAQTRDAGRTDVIVDYRGEQFVVEMKIWRGNEYNERGERQLAEYLDYYRQKKGYMLSFNFNKKKEIGVKEIRFGDKMIVEAVV